MTTKFFLEVSGRSKSLIKQALCGQQLIKKAYVRVSKYKKEFEENHKLQNSHFTLLPELDCRFIKEYLKLTIYSRCSLCTEAFKTALKEPKSVAKVRCSQMFEVVVKRNTYFCFPNENTYVK